jgi:hypothetical protein
MKKYLQNRKTTEIQCFNCKKFCLKPNSEIIRSKKINRNMFCSRNCSISFNNKGIQRNKITDISKYCNNKIDKYTPIRTYYTRSKKRLKEFNLTLDELLNQWNKQNGICPYTNLKMDLKNSTKSLKKASLDRIDSNKGYTSDNIEFVCLGINYMKSNFTKQQVSEFLNSFNLKLL